MAARRTDGRSRLETPSPGALHFSSAASISVGFFLDAALLRWATKQPDRRAGHDPLEREGSLFAHQLDFLLPAAKHAEQDFVLGHQKEPEVLHVVRRGGEVVTQATVDGTGVSFGHPRPEALGQVARLLAATGIHTAGRYESTSSGATGKTLCFVVGDPWRGRQPGPMGADAEGIESGLEAREAEHENRGSSLASG
jgi:hypothetical protein